MKKTILLFPRGTYLSNTDGTAKTHRCSDEVRKLAGKAKLVRYQLIGFRRSTNAGAKLKMWETASMDLRPSEAIPGGAPFFTGAEATSLRPVPETITGPFCENAEFTLEVRATAGAATEEWDGEVWGTLVFEE